jgi:hypothetical protein
MLEWWSSTATAGGRRSSSSDPHRQGGVAILSRWDPRSGGRGGSTPRRPRRCRGSVAPSTTACRGKSTQMVCVQLRGRGTGDWSDVARSWSRGSRRRTRTPASWSGHHGSRLGLRRSCRPRLPATWCAPGWPGPRGVAAASGWARIGPDLPRWFGWTSYDADTTVENSVTSSNEAAYRHQGGDHRTAAGQGVVRGEGAYPTSGL